MKLFYRGATYNYTPYEIETIETPTTASFLGVNYKVRRPANLPTFSPSVAVRYRGIPYLGQ
jgi:hypothetical protein